MDQPDIIARCGFHELILPKGISFKKISEDEYIMIKILIQWFTVIIRAVAIEFVQSISIYTYIII